LLRKNSEAYRFVSHTGIYATGIFLRQLASFLLLPIYTRYLTPADYGVVGLMIFAISLSEVLFGARLGQAIPKYYYEVENKQERNAVISTSLLLTSGVSLLGTIILIYFSNLVSQGLYGSNEYSLLVSIFSVTLLTQGLESYTLLYIRIQQRPLFYILINFSKLVIQISINIWLVVFLQLGAMGVAISAMASSSLMAWLLGFYTLRDVGFEFNRNLAVKMVRFSWPLWLSGLAGLYIGLSNRYYIRLFSSLDEVGLFELAIKFGTIVTVLIWQPFFMFWQVERFKYYKLENAKIIFRKVFSLISSLLILSALGISLFAENIITIMTDPSFYSSALAVPFLCYAFVFENLVNFFNFSFFIKDKTLWLTRNQYITAFIITVCYLILIPIAGFIGAAIAVMLSRSMQFMLVYYTSRKVYDMLINLRYIFYMIFVSALALIINYYFVTSEYNLQRILMKLPIFISASILIVLPLLNIHQIRSILYKRLKYERSSTT